MPRTLKYLLVFFLFLLDSLVVQKAAAQENWTLSTENAGIKVYTRPILNSKIQAIKVVGEIQAKPSQLLAAIMDIATCDQWVYHSKQNVMVRKISPLELIYYSEVAVPWPVENRDYVVHIQASQHPLTRVITINSPCVPGYVPVKPHVVRISHTVGKWTLTPVSEHLVKAEYMLEVDPLGSIPAWLVNLFATKGPLETFKKLRIHVQQEVYKQARYAGIEDAP